MAGLTEEGSPGKLLLALNKMEVVGTELVAMFSLRLETQLWTRAKQKKKRDVKKRRHWIKLVIYQTNFFFYSLLLLLLIREAGSIPQEVFSTSWNWYYFFQHCHQRLGKQKCIKRQPCLWGLQSLEKIILDKKTRLYVNMTQSGQNRSLLWVKTRKTSIHLFILAYIHYLVDTEHPLCWRS